MKHYNKYIISTIIIHTIISLIFVTIVTYFRNEKQEATNDNYESLSKQLEVIINDFDKVYSFNNYNIEPTDDGTKVSLTVHSDSCTLIGYFDNDLNYIKQSYRYPYLVTTQGYVILIAVFLLFEIPLCIFCCSKTLISKIQIKEQRVHNR